MNFENLLLLLNDCPLIHFHSLNEVFFPDVHMAELPLLAFRKLVKSSCSCWLQMTGRVDPLLLLQRLHASVQLNSPLPTSK